MNTHNKNIFGAVDVTQWIGCPHQALVSVPRTTEPALVVQRRWGENK